jgi:hypothetical protein
VARRSYAILLGLVEGGHGGDGQEEADELETDHFATLADDSRQPAAFIPPCLLSGKEIA